MWFLVLCLVLSLWKSGSEPLAQSRASASWVCAKRSQTWQAAVYRDGSAVCVGVLVHPKWVVTAAHCMINKDPADYRVSLGSQDPAATGSAAQRIQVSGTFPHPYYNLSCLSPSAAERPPVCPHDLLLLRLARPASLSDSVQLAELPSRPPLLRSSCLASGWGLAKPGSGSPPGKLRCAEFRIVRQKLCHVAYSPLISRTMTCAGFLQDGKEACLGDWGGPLICNGKLQGITAQGSFPCVQGQKPAVYTKMVYYTNWIQASIKMYS